MLTYYLIGSVLIFVTITAYALYDLKPWKDRMYAPNWGRFVSASLVYGVFWPFVVLYIICMALTKSLDFASKMIAKWLGKLFPVKRRKTF